MTFLAEDAIIAEPVVLETLFALFGTGQAVRVETFAAEIASQKVLLQSKGPAEIAHLLEDQTRIIKRYSDWVAVPT